MRVGMVGATGAVGAELLKVLEERRFPVSDLRLLASQRSEGRAISWGGRNWSVKPLDPQAVRGLDVVFFSAGKGVSREYAPLAARAGALVVDNSSAFRMDADVPLVVPEINGGTAAGHRGIIAVPNCTAIILCMAVWPLHRLAGLMRIAVSTYQAVSGAGARALAELQAQTRDVLEGRPPRPQVLPHPIAFNLFSHNTAIGPDGFNEEETKVHQETRRILGIDDLAISATCIRVPIPRAHGLSAALTFERPIDESAAREALRTAPGLRLVDDRSANRFPMPIEASGSDDVLVGRLRSDPSQPPGRGLLLFACGDQLRKGAALNAVQIAEMATQG